MVIGGWFVFVLFPIVYCANYTKLNIQQNEGIVSKVMSFNFNQTTEQLLIFSTNSSINPYRIKAWSFNATIDAPILVVVRKEREVLSWQIPFIVSTSIEDKVLHFQNTSRTLCHNNMSTIIQNNRPIKLMIQDLSQKFIVSLSTSSVINIDVSVLVQEEQEFYLNEDKIYNITVSCSEPKYYYYKFNKNKKLTNAMINIISPDDVCLTVSVQDSICPVFDLDKDITFKGKHQTINLIGGMTVEEREYPNGFFLVFVAKADNYECLMKNLYPFEIRESAIVTDKRISAITFSIKKTINMSDYLMEILLTLAFFGTFYAIAIVIVFASTIWNTILRCLISRRDPNNYSLLTDDKLEESVVEDKHDHLADSDKVQELVMPEEHNHQSLQANDNKLEEPVVTKKHDVADGDKVQNPVKPDKQKQVLLDTKKHLTLDVLSETPSRKLTDNDKVEEVVMLEEHNHQSLQASSNKLEEPVVTKKHDDVADGDKVQNPVIPADQRQALLDTKTHLTLDLLSETPSRNYIRSKYYISYIWNTGIFYGIPVVQLAWTYQKVVNTTGNEDICYYNFLCANPIHGVFMDFNHVFSNVGYLLLGLLFLGLVWHRSKKIPASNLRNFCFLKARLMTNILQTGIPIDYSLYYAMGYALIAEGVLSACYHVCPSQSNFQFDTSFMYIIAILCLIKLYQNRHPDKTPSARATFFVLGVAILLALIGILSENLIVWIIFDVIYVLLCFYISIKIYYLKKFSDGFKHFFKNTQTTIPFRKDRFLFVVIGNILNLGILIAGVVLQTYKIIDFGTYLLVILIVNLLYYLLLYVYRKCKHEKVCKEAIIYGLLSATSWVGSIILFWNNTISWIDSPAASRQKNQACVFMDFYDKHDLWHFLSAISLFLTFMFLLCLDDDITDKKREEIEVF